MNQPSELKVWGEDLPESIKYEFCEDEESHTIRFTQDAVALIVGCGHTTWLDGTPAPWATVYGIETVENRASGVTLRKLLKAVQSHYKKHGYDFAVSSADTPWQEFHIDLAGVPVRETCSGVIVDKRKLALCESA